MDARRFDDVTKGFAAGTTRRGVLTLFTAAVGGLLTGGGLPRRIGATQDATPPSPTEGPRYDDPEEQDRLAHVREIRLAWEQQYGEVVELDSAAAALVVELDRAQREGGSPDDWAEQEADLTQRDEAVLEGIRALYGIAGADPQPETDALLVRTALLHWLVLLRIRAMRGVHTLVPGLQDDSDCEGDLIADHILLRYFDTLFAEENEATGIANASIALAAIARQTACLGAGQMAELARELYLSHSELQIFLGRHGLDRIDVLVTQAAAAPLLLIHDAERSRGADGFMRHWFAEHEEALLDGVLTGRLPLAWHGLWLLDWRSGHLIRYRAVNEVVDENDVNLYQFLQSVGNPVNLGTFACSLAEIVERGPTSMGYLCTAQLCQELEEGGIDTAEVSICAQSGGGGGGADGSSRCGGSSEVGGASRYATTLACVTEQVSRPYQRQMSCMSEAMGLCADPVEKATKELRRTAMPGIKVPPGCEVSTDLSGSLYPLVPSKEVQEKAKELDEAQDRYKAASALLDTGVREWQQAEQELKDAQASGDKGRVLLAEANSERKWDQAQAAARVWSDAFKNLKKADEEYQRAIDAQLGSNKRCDPSLDSCRDACTGHAQGAMQAMECFEESADPAADPFAGGGGVTDPAPDDDPQAPQWAACLETLVDPMFVAVAKQCWAVQCANGLATVGGPSGCGCGSMYYGMPSQQHLMVSCGPMDCANGVPSWQNGCTCASDGGFVVPKLPSGGPDGSLIPMGYTTFSGGRPFDFP